MKSSLQNCNRKEEKHVGKNNVRQDSSWNIFREVGRLQDMCRTCETRIKHLRKTRYEICP